MKFTVSLAGLVIGVESLFDEVYRLCAPYLVPDTEPELRVCIGPEAIAAERRRSVRQDLAEGRIPVIYPDEYLETLAVYRQIAEAAPRFGVFLLHGSAVAVGERCWLFTAPSGVGKTTHTRLWLENIEGSFVVNGDKPLLRYTDGGFRVYGTPWAGKEGWNQNTSVPLKGLVFLRRGAENRIERASAAEMLPFLISQTYRSAEVAGQKKTLALLQALCREVPFYKLDCNMDAAAALTAYQGMQG